MGIRDWISGLGGRKKPKANRPVTPKAKNTRPYNKRPLGTPPPKDS